MVITFRFSFIVVHSKTEKARGEREREKASGRERKQGENCHVN